MNVVRTWLSIVTLSLAYFRKVLSIRVNFTIEMSKICIENKVTNLGENEKMTEELLNSNETIEITNNPMYNRIQSTTIINDEIRNEIIDIVAQNKEGNSDWVPRKINRLQHKIVQFL